MNPFRQSLWGNLKGLPFRDPTIDIVETPFATELVEVSNLAEGVGQRALITRMLIVGHWQRVHK